MAVSVAQTCNALANNQDAVELAKALTAMQADIAALRAAFVALTAKMDADFANVTNASVDYATSVNPAALKSAA